METIRVRGTQEAIRALAEAGARIKAAIPAATRAGAEAVAPIAIGQAPRATGELAGSVTVQQTGERAIVTATARHARFVEFGTSRMSAQPYLEPAAEMGRAAAIAAAAVIFKAALRGL